MAEEKEKLGAFPYVVGGLSFIPLLGVLFGLIAILWGAFTKKSGGGKLALVGGCGIAFTVAIYSALFYFAVKDNGKMFQKGRDLIARNSLTSAVQAVEFYKAQNGRYPASLQELQASLPEQSFIILIDPTQATGFSKTPSLFFYQLVGKDHYYLRAIGPDGKPFTEDDILPPLTKTPGSKIGLLIERQIP